MFVYEKGDVRRMLLVLTAIETLDSPTMVSIAKDTGLDKRTVTHLIKQAQSQCGVVVSKNGAVYKLLDWGPLLKRDGAYLAKDGALGDKKPC